MTTPPTQIGVPQLRSRPVDGPPMDNTSAGAMLAVGVVVAVAILGAVLVNVQRELHSDAPMKASTPAQETSTAPAQPAQNPGG